jgi:hypothetical protein
MSGVLVRGARGFARNRTEEAHVRPWGTNMGHPEQKLIRDRSETVATRQSHIKILAGLECPSRWLFEPEGHGAFRNFLAIF